MKGRRSLQSRLRELAGGLLRGGRLDLLLGFRASGLPFRARPAVLHRPEEAAHLVWNSFCSNSLAAYLPDWIAVAAAHGPPVRVGLAAKPCDARAALRLVAEGVVARERLFLIGLHCRGMLDRRRAEALLAPREALGAGEDAAGEVRVVVDDGSEVTLSRAALLHPVCRACRRREPEGYDHLLEAVAAGGPDSTPDPAPGSPADRTADSEPPPGPSTDAACRAQVVRAISQCIVCGACRSVCPLDDEDWRVCAGHGDPRVDLHRDRHRRLAGRCVACGACHRACPAGVDPLILVRPSPSGGSPLDLLRTPTGVPRADGAPRP